MTPLFKKLNFKGQPEICLLNHPKEFNREAESMTNYTTIKTDISDGKEFHFILTFVKTKTDIENISPIIHQRLEGDGIVWFAYPKGTSKKYKVEINRDNGWEILGDLGFEGVRAVAIDEDWSALRFRKVEFIKTMTRRADFALTKEGQNKTKPASR